MELLGDVGHVECHFGLFRDSIVSVPDRCTVCVERTVGSKNVLTHPIELLVHVGYVESRFVPFGEC